MVSGYYLYGITAVGIHKNAVRNPFKELSYYLM